MEYKLFDEYITLQALLKETGIIQSGGAAKAFLHDHQVFFNGEPEQRRGKKLRVNDQIQIPDLKIDLYLTAPSPAELEQRKEDEAEKKRVAQLVKEMNKSVKKNKKTEAGPAKKGPVRFPGT